MRPISASWRRRVARLRGLFSRAAAPPRVDRIVVGLGNPGDGYANTRHNVGFQVASRLAKRARAEFALKAADSRIAEGSIDGVRIAIARPQTFMNDSGRAVRKLLDRYRIQPSELLVVFDEVDLPLGKIRLREKGGPGTHNGMRSIVSAIGEDFPRLRVGVAPADPLREIGDLVQYVLDPFEADERTVAETSLTRAAEAAEVALREGIQPAMTKFNG